MSEVGTPTLRGMRGAATDYLYGAGGGLFYMLASGLFGNGLLGGLAGAAIAGSMIKGAKGEILATMLGFQGAMSMLTGGDAETAPTAIIM